MSDDNIAENLAHVPGAGASPIDTHGVETPHTSTVERELATSTGLHQHPTLIPPKIDPIRVGVMSNPVISPEPSGARVQSFSPLGRHDTDGK